MTYHCKLQKLADDEASHQQVITGILDKYESSIAYLAKKPAWMRFLFNPIYPFWLLISADIKRMDAVMKFEGVRNKAILTILESE